MNIPNLEVLIYLFQCIPKHGYTVRRCTGNIAAVPESTITAPGSPDQSQSARLLRVHDVDELLNADSCVESKIENNNRERKNNSF